MTSIGDFLRKIGMSPKYKGYGYLYYIFSITTKTPDYVYSLTKTVYPLVVTKFKTTISGVERNIRFAIHKTWESGDKEFIGNIFGKHCINWPPSNSEFISVVTIALKDSYMSDWDHNASEAKADENKAMNE